MYHQEEQVSYVTYEKFVKLYHNHTLVITLSDTLLDTVELGEHYLVGKERSYQKAFIVYGVSLSPCTRSLVGIKSNMDDMDRLLKWM